MSVDVLCNQPQYNTVTDMWGMCTNLTAWKILVPLRDGPGNEQTSYFSTLWITPFSKSFIISTICGSKFSLQLFTLALVRDILQEAGRVSRPQATLGRLASPISQLKQHGIRQTMAFGREENWCHVGSAKKESKDKIKVSRTQFGVVCYTMS